MIDDNTWDMLTGKVGRLPGELAPELVELAKSQGREFYDGAPQDLYPDDLENIKKEMKKEGWDFGQDDEELMEYAMHKAQYIAYKSGKAKEDFEADLKKRKDAKAAPAPAVTSAATPAANAMPQVMNVDVNGEKFTVKVSYGEQPVAANEAQSAATTAVAPSSSSNGFAEVIAPIEGNFTLTKDNTEKAIAVGDDIKKGDLIGYIEAMKVYNAITSDKSGKVVEICATNGDYIDEDDVIIKLQ
jgi:pyruvate carboxylase subunit B